MIERLNVILFALRSIAIMGLFTAVSGFGQAVTASIEFSNLAASQVTIDFISPVYSTGYFTVLRGSAAACGTAAQTVQGEDSSGAKVIHGSLWLIGDSLDYTVRNPYTVRNLFESTTYKVCFTLDGTSEPISASFTTTASRPADPSWTNLAATGFSPSTAHCPSIAFSPDGTPYVAFQDDSVGGRITVMRFNETAGQIVGAAGFADATSTCESLVFAPDGSPYVAFADTSYGYAASVMRFNGTDWEYVGNPGFLAGHANQIALAFAPDGSPYVGYQDSVKRFNGSAWENVGQPRILGGPYISLAFSPDGTPYVGFIAWGWQNEYYLLVNRYAGGSWTYAGDTGGCAQRGPVNLVFSPDGSPYVAYLLPPDLYEVMRFNGSAWVKMAELNLLFSGTGHEFLEGFAISPDGTYLMLIGDDRANFPAKLMRYNGSTWVGVGNPSFLYFQPFALSPDGTPYVAYIGQDGKAAVMRLHIPPPSATTGWETGLTAIRATLNGTVNSNGTNTTVSFDYGTTASYGTNIPASTGGFISAGTGNIQVAVNLTSLTPNTLYHYRVSATADHMTTKGADATFTTPSLIPPAITSPAAGSYLGGPTSFVWTPGNGATYFQLSVGTNGAGSSDVYAGSAKSATSSPSINIAANGTNIYVRLAYQINGAWTNIDYTYPTASAVTVLSPLHGSTLTGSSATFKWTPGAGTTRYQLRLGTKGQSSLDVYNSGPISGTSVTVSNIPTVGGTLYVRIYSLAGTTWNYIDYTCTQAPPAMVSPASTLPGSSAQFQWNPHSGVTTYQLRVGTKGQSSNDVFNSGVTSNTSFLVTNIPTLGGTVYVRLYYRTGPIWQYLDYTYTEALPTMSPTSPFLTGSSATFQWNAGTAGTRYELRVGTQGWATYDLLNTGVTTSASFRVDDIPMQREEVWVRLYYEVGGGWKYTDYHYLEAAPLESLSPARNSIVGGSQIFKWTGTGTSPYQLRIGTQGQGSNNVYDSGAISGTTMQVSNLPMIGGPLYVRLYYQAGSSRQYIDSIYTQLGPWIVSPRQGSILTGSSALVQWDPGTGVTNYQLRVGTQGQASDDVFRSGVISSNSVTVNNIPTKGGTLYFRLYYWTGSVWKYIDWICVEAAH